jgi:hypothetical protein
MEYKDAKFLVEGVSREKFGHGRIEPASTTKALCTLVHDLVRRLDTTEREVFKPKQEGNTWGSGAVGCQTVQPEREPSRGTPPNRPDWVDPCKTITTPPYNLPNAQPNGPAGPTITLGLTNDHDISSVLKQALLEIAENRLLDLDKRLAAASLLVDLLLVRAA